MTNLFAAAASNMGPKPLVSFRAGRMFKEGTTMKPDKRKGMLQLVQSEDSLVHFQWKDRYTGQTEEDLILFPGDATFVRVAKCTTGRVYMLEFKDSHRQLLYWMQEPKEDKDEENCKTVNRHITSPPPPPRPGSAGGAGGRAGLNLASLAEGGGGGGEAINIPGLGNVNRNQLIDIFQAMQSSGLIAGSGGSSRPTSSSSRSGTAATASAATASSTATTPGAAATAGPASRGTAAGGSGSGSGSGGVVELATLQNILASLGAGGSATPSSGSRAAAATSSRPTSTSGVTGTPAGTGAGASAPGTTTAASEESRALAELLTQQLLQGQSSEDMSTHVNLMHVMDSAQVLSAMNTREGALQTFTNRLLEHLPPIPEGVTPQEHFMENLRSSQLQQSISLLQSALDDPEAYREITHAFGIVPATNPNALATTSATSAVPAGVLPPNTDTFGTYAFLNAVQQQASPSASNAMAVDEQPGTSTTTSTSPNTTTTTTSPAPPAKDSDKMEE